MTTLDKNLKALIEEYLQRKAGYQPPSFDPIPDPYYGPDIMLGTVTTSEGWYFSVYLYTDAPEAIYQRLVQIDHLWFRVNLLEEIVVVAANLETGCIAAIGELTEQSKNEIMKRAKQRKVDLTMKFPLAVESFNMKLTSNPEV